jgi:hypothetical protein
MTCTELVLQLFKQILPHITETQIQRKFSVYDLKLYELLNSIIISVL